MLPISNERFYQSAFDNMFNGFAHCRGIYDDAERLIDFVYVVVNQAFEKHTGLKNVIGKRVTEVIPNIFEATPLLFEIYGRVSKGGPPESFEQYVEGLNIWFSIWVYSTEQNTFTAIFENVSEYKQLAIDLEAANRDVLQAYDDTLMCLVRALQFRDAETDHHSERVTEMMVAFAEYVGIDKKYHADVRRGALLHDIGKMFIADSILRKPGRLTYDETLEMQRHPQLAYNLLSPIKYMQGCVLDIPYCHHERWNGSGYPQGLKSKAIPLCARLFTLVDVYDAMTSDRIYRKALSKTFTLTYLSLQSGILFDPVLVSQFLKFIEKFYL